MLFRRVSKHVKDQNWFAVGIDFFIVVIGVFLGIQVANWNATQASKRTAQASVESVQAEISSNRKRIQIWIDNYETLSKHALATLDVLELPEEQRGEQFVVDAYQASSYAQFTLPRDAYNDFLALGPSKALIDEDIRQHLVKYYFFLDAMSLTLQYVPAYRSHLRSVMPHDVVIRIRTECPARINVLETSIQLPETCQPELSADQIERAIAELSAVNFKPDLNLTLSDLYLKTGILRLVLNASQELDNFIEETK